MWCMRNQVFSPTLILQLYLAIYLWKYVVEIKHTFSHTLHQSEPYPILIKTPSASYKCNCVIQRAF